MLCIHLADRINEDMTPE